MTGTDVERLEAERQRALRAVRFGRRRKLRRVTTLRSADRLDDEGLPLSRVAACGVARHAMADVVTVGINADGIAGYGGLQTCGSVWVCPCCSGSIRQGRAVEVEQAVTTLFARGGAAVMAALTLPHDVDDALADLMDATGKAWTFITDSRRWRRECEQLGLLLPKQRRQGSPDHVTQLRRAIGVIRAQEVTYGLNGWHPHLHVVLLFVRPLTEAESARMRRLLAELWAEYVTARGWRSPSAERGIDWQQVTTAESGRVVAQYVSKDQDGDVRRRGLGLEMARGDLKQGRRKHSRTPFEILDLVDLDDQRKLEAEQTEGRRARRRSAAAKARRLWAEYEQATKGRAALTWTQQLKTVLLVDDVTDEDLAAVEPAVTQLHLVDDDWRLVRAYRREANLLVAIECGGPDAGRAVVAACRARAAFAMSKALAIVDRAGLRQQVDVTNVMPPAVDVDAVQLVLGLPAA